jgi:hypothetical protein
MWLFSNAVPILVVVVIACAGCGCFTAGTWEDDPDNWERAFNSRKPDHVIVVHSRFSRFPHFTDEFEYFFHIRANSTLRDQIFQNNDLVGVEDTTEVSHYYEGGGKIPGWFLPKPAGRYDAWQCRDISWCTYKVFIDRDNGDIFITDRQL